ncbi:hypothetical protein AW736_14100 [Termitidicoccus mucosus]|uniref:Uncharacterized protein n=1 Tax=Termitidicoccus mucosus TaxID=1184151 RepID=A0A178IGU4_9BACT|nr:hypothetical protein AW736_14100 [Opitutaceae bacterium TSB47]
MPISAIFFQLPVRHVVLAFHGFLGAGEVGFCVGLVGGSGFLRFSATCEKQSGTERGGNGNARFKDGNSHGGMGKYFEEWIF